MKQQNYDYGYHSHQEGTLFAAKEAYRTIRTNLMFSVAKAGCKTVLFSSAISGEGKTTSAANVAFSIARGNKKVLLMDLDLRNPHIHRLLKKSGSPGLTNYLSGFNSLDEIVQREVYPNLDVVFAGTMSPNPAEMVASEGMAELLKKMEKYYDFIIIDTPPLNLVSDALSLVRNTDGMVLVVRPKYTARKELQKAVGQVEFVEGKILGVIVNGVQTEKKGYNRYSRYGKYGKYGYGKYGYGRRAAKVESVQQSIRQEEVPDKSIKQADIAAVHEEKDAE